MDWNVFFSDFAKRRKGVVLRNAAKYIMRTDFINLGGGIPNAVLFPFEGATFKLSDGNSISFSPKDMENALQYGETDGYPELLPELIKLIKRYHNPPNMEDRAIALTTGCQEAISKSLDLLMSMGDPVIIQKHVYSGILSVLSPYKPKFLYVEEDENGIVPQSLRDVMQGSMTNKKNYNFIPKFFYTIPNGCNPTGATTSGERRKEIYKICQEYNLIILEDNAYFFLHYGEKCEPSYLSLDIDGRVILMDSISKIIAPGLRFGYACASKEVVRRMNIHSQSTIQQVSPMIQLILYKLLRAWDENGFDDQIKKVRKFYKYQRDVMIAAAEKWLSGLAEWSVPTGGMFVWFRVLGIKDTTRLCNNAIKDHSIVVFPGSYFMPEEGNSDFIRVSFTSTTPQKVDEAFEKLARAICEDKLLV